MVQVNVMLCYIDHDISQSDLPHGLLGHGLGAHLLIGFENRDSLTELWFSPLSQYYSFLITVISLSRLRYRAVHYYG